MTTYYVDPAATGAADGSSWTDAWTTLQAAFDAVAAGDTVYCRGTETCSAQIDVDTTSATATNWINIIGCNASGDVDGTRYKLDFSGTTVDGIVHTNGKSYYRYVNLELYRTDAGGSPEGISTTGSGAVFNEYYNVLVDGWHYGFNDGYQGSCKGLRAGCVAKNCGGAGFYPVNTRECVYYGCVAHDCNYGINSASAADALFYGCLFYSNTTASLNCSYGNCGRFVHCVFDDTASHILNPGDRLCFVACRFSNATAYTYNSSSLSSFWFACYSDSAGSGFSPGTLNANYYDIPYRGSATSEFSGSDTDSGYTDSSSADYNLAAGATLRSQQFDLQDS